jgi:hypothetical protein
VTVSAADVSAAARAILIAHLPARLALGVNGRAALPEPTSYAEVPTAEAVRRVKKSVLAVMVPQIIGSPERFGDGTYDVTFLLSVAVWHEQTHDLPLLSAAADYVAAIRETLLAHPTLGGLATDATWTDESVDLVGDATSVLTLGMGICEFAVRVPNVTAPEPGAVTGPTVLDTEVFVNP